MIKILDIENIKIPSINKRYYKNFSLTSEYKNFKKNLFYQFVQCNIQPPYRVEILVETYLDIDNLLKPIFDTMQDKEIITDDRYILELSISKTPTKRGAESKIIIFIESIKN